VTVTSDEAARRRSVGRIGHALAVLALAGSLAVGLLADGRARAVALGLVALWLLLGLLVVALRRAHETGRLFHHLAFVGVVPAAGVAGDGLRQVVAGTAPTPIPAALGLGGCVGALWLGARLVYGGPFDRVLARLRPPAG
jgi:hypothetical protein